MMKRLTIPLLVLLMLVANLASVHAAPPPQYTVQGIVNLAPSTPQLTAVDPFANGLTPVNPLKPKRPFWYVADKNGLTIMGLRTERTGALMVGGPPIDVVKDQVVGYVPWPNAISIAQPDGEVPVDPTVDPDKFAYRPAAGWEPVGITVSYPTDEALASNSETPATYVYVVMKHSGYEWRSETNLPAGRDPYLRDKIVAQPDPSKDGSLLVQVDVSQPNYPADLFPTGTPIGGGLLGHDAGQPAFDPGADSVYVGNMPTTSLPTTPAVPNDLTSFVSVVTLAPAELPAPGEVPAPVTVTVLCGPEHPDVPILAGVPQSWACIAEGGEGPFTWSFTNLPPWLKEHIDPITNIGDGILYGTPAVGTWTFRAHVDDHATTPPGTGDATITLIVTSDPTTEYEYGELEWEVGTPAAVAIEGTLKPGATGDPCALTPTASPGSMVPNWVSVAQITGRRIDNSSVGGGVENTIGCVVMGTPPISGERYEFQMPNFQFTWPSQNLPIVISGQVAGPYTFDPLPAGVGLSGLAWHQIDKIHDPSTEADLLNREFFGVEPYTGDMYRIVPAYAGLEAEGTVIPPPALQGELDEVELYAGLLTPLLAARPDIAAGFAANPNLRLRFGNVAVQANPNAQVFVTAPELSDSMGVVPTVIPIGGTAGSNIPIGAIVKVTGTRDLQEPDGLTLGSITAIDLPGIQAYHLGLDSDLAPAVPGEPGQLDNGVLWVTGTTTGNLATIDTQLGRYAQILAIPGTTSLGGVSVYSTTRVAYVATPSLNSVTLFAPGTSTSTAPIIWSAASTTFIAGSNNSFKVTATGTPLPTLSLQGTVPDGVTFTSNGDGTATLAGTPSVAGSYPVTITASNGTLPNATQNFVLVVNAAGPDTAPVVTTQPSSQTVTVGQAATFAAAATGAPPPTVQWQQSTDSGSTFNNISGATGTSYTTAAATAAMNGYQYRAVFTNGIGSATSNAASLTVTAANHPPVATGQSVTTAEDTAKAITVSGSDPDGDALTYSVVAGPLHGALSGTVPNLTYTPALNYYGLDNFTFKANDGKIDSATAMVSITVTSVNDAPIALAQSVTTAEGTAQAITLTGTDVENNPLQYVLLSLPLHGSLGGTLPNLTYFPAGGFFGADSFSFKVNDGALDSAPATVSLTVTAVNHQPIASAQSVTTVQDTPKAITLSGSDADGNPLTYAVVTQPAHGTLSGTAPNLTYTPTPRYSGPDSFTFKVNDGTVDSAPGTVSITVTPAIVPLAVATTSLPNGTVNVAYSAQLQATGGVQPYRWSVTSGRIPQGLRLSTTGLLSGSPNVAGTYRFTARVSDSASASASTSFTVTIAPRAPRR
jgi:hypothetical protein